MAFMASKIRSATFKDNRLHSLKVLFFFVSITILITAGTAYYVLGSSARKALIAVAQTREMQHAKTGSAAISSFFQLYQNSFLVLAQDENLMSPNDATRQNELDQFIKIWRKTIVGEVILLDKNGYLKNASFPGPLEKVSLANRDYFQWAKTAKQGHFFIGEPLVAKAGVFKDQYILPVATPIIVNDHFEGVLTSSISITKLAENYILPLQISPKTRVYIINPKQVVLYTVDPQS